VFIPKIPADKGLLRPFAQFSRGILMATQRGQFGNTVYFWDEIKAGGWWYFFPVTYFFKVPLALHLLSLLGLLGIFWSIKRKLYQGILEGIMGWIKDHFMLFSIALFSAAYWMIAMAGNLNIGIRHMLPTFPIAYILIIWGIKELYEGIQSLQLKRALIVIVLILFGWYGVSSFLAYPHYISYYNEAAGGIENGYKVSVDSNYDWGQDFGSLVQFIEANNIEKIHLDYFGGENPEYWLGDTYVRLDAKAVAQDLSRGLALSEAGGGVEGWIAVSLNQFMGGIAKPVEGFDQETGYYNWLLEYTPVAKAGNTIFIYNIE